MQEELAEQTWDLTHSDSDSELKVCIVGEEYPEPECDLEQVSKEQEDGLDPQPPDAKPWSRPAAEPTSRPAVEPTSRPAAEPTSRPAVEPSSRPAAEPSSRPAAEPSSRPAVEPSSRPAADLNHYCQHYWPEQLWSEDETATLSQAPRQETSGSRDRDLCDRPCHHHHSCCSESGFEVMVRREPLAPVQALQSTEDWVQHQPAFLSRQDVYAPYATQGYGLGHLELEPVAEQLDLRWEQLPPAEDFQQPHSFPPRREGHWRYEVLPRTGDTLQQPRYPSGQEEYAGTYRRRVLPRMGDWLQQPGNPSRQEEYAGTYRRRLMDVLRWAHEAPHSTEIDLTQEYPYNGSTWMLSAHQLECSVRRHQYALTLLRAIQAQRAGLLSRPHQSPPMPFVGHPDLVLSGSDVAGAGLYAVGSDRPPAPELGFGPGRGRGRMPLVLRELGFGRGRGGLEQAYRDFGN